MPSTKHTIGVASLSELRERRGTARRDEARGRNAPWRSAAQRARPRPRPARTDRRTASAERVGRRSRRVTRASPRSAKPGSESRRPGAERTRQQAILAESRSPELELRAPEVARKRDVDGAVTAAATLAAFVLIYVAIDRTERPRCATARARRGAQKRDMKHQLEELSLRSRACRRPRRACRRRRSRRAMISRMPRAAKRKPRRRQGEGDSMRGACAQGPSATSFARRAIASRTRRSRSRSTRIA